MGLGSQGMSSLVVGIMLHPWLVFLQIACSAPSVSYSGEWWRYVIIRKDAKPCLCWAVSQPWCMVSVQTAKWTEEGRKVGGCGRGLSMHCKPSAANWGSIISLEGNSLWSMWASVELTFERTAVENLLLSGKGFHSGKQLEVGAGKLRGKKG